MSNSWDSWKVGDKLECRKATGGCAVGHVVTVKYNGLSSAGKGLTIVTRSDGREIGIADYGPSDNPSTYFFFPSPTLPPYRVGDRVQRTASDNNGTIPTGTEGTVTDVAVDQLVILWDVPYQDNGSYPYAWPARAAYFSAISSGQSAQRVLQCSRCNDGGNPYAVANQPDGSYKCWSCRKYPYR